MTLYRVLLREEAARALRAANTIAGPNVFTARSWPIRPEALPMIQLQVLADHAESWGAAQPGYTRTAGLLVTARVEFGTPAEGEDLLDTITEQIETTLMLDTALQAMLEQVSTIQTELAFDSGSGQQIGTARMRFDLQYPQTYAPSGVPLARINASIRDAGTGTVLAAAEIDLPPTS